MDLAALARERRARHGAPPRAPSAAERRLSNLRNSVATFIMRDGGRAKWLVAIVVLLGYGYRTVEDPFADGNVPAARWAPHEHWRTIRGWDRFVHDMTAHSRKRSWFRRVVLNLRTDKEELDHSDSGGEDGHEAESPTDIFNGRFEDSLRVTRCTSTQTAVIAYFCGTDVAANQDRKAEGGPKGSFGSHDASGIAKFEELLASKHSLAEVSGGVHERAVFRLGVGSEDGKAGYAHVWTIVGLPSGRYLWLQSFVSHYSLHKWMDTVDASTDGKGAEGLALATLKSKLKLLSTLFRIKVWDEAANSAYLELFGVDMIKSKAWSKHEHISHQRLGHFSWDTACAFPTPAEPVPGDPDGALQRYASLVESLDGADPQDVAAALGEMLGKPVGQSLLERRAKEGGSEEEEEEEEEEDDDQEDDMTE